MDPDVVHDPVFQALLVKYEIAGRKLRDSVIAMRSFYLTHHKRPHDETPSEKWRGALLGEDAAQRHIDVEDAAAQLLRYAFEIAPHCNDALHLEELYHLKLAHKERLERRTGWGRPEPHPKGIEEKVTIDGGPPITLVIEPKHWDYTERGKRAAARKASNEGSGKEPARTHEEGPPSPIDD
jgi:hypothetical protein